MPKRIATTLNEPEKVEADVDFEEEDKPKKVQVFSTLKKTADIRSAKDLLILEVKREMHPDLSPSFSVGAYTAAPGDNYETKLTEALKFIHSCLFTHDRDGDRLSSFAQAHRLKAIGVELPPHLANYSYIPDKEAVPPYWADADNYAYLWKQRRPPVEEY
jgi:hypothetical protein